MYQPVVEFSVLILKFSWNLNCFCIWIIVQSVVDSCYPSAREQELENGTLQADGSSTENIFSSCKEETIFCFQKRVLPKARGSGETGRWFPSRLHFIDWFTVYFVAIELCL